MNRHDFEIVEAAIKYLDIAKIDVKALAQDINIEYQYFGNIILGEKVSDEIGHRIMWAIYDKHPDILWKAIDYSFRNNRFQKTECAQDWFDVVTE